MEYLIVVKEDGKKEPIIMYEIETVNFRVAYRCALMEARCLCDRDISGGRVVITEKINDDIHPWHDASYVFRVDNYWKNWNNIELLRIKGVKAHTITLVDSPRHRERIKEVIEE